LLCLYGPEKFPGLSRNGLQSPNVYSYFASKILVAGPTLVSFAAVFRLVTQRSSPQTAAFFRTTFLFLCLSIQAIDQPYHNDCLQSNQSNCSKKTFPRICESGMSISANLNLVPRVSHLCLPWSLEVVRDARSNTVFCLCALLVNWSHSAALRGSKQPKHT